MNKYRADMYKNDIYDINYKKLKNIGIKVLIYDFDNTIIAQNKKNVSQKLKDLFSLLKKDFLVIIISNTLNRKKIESFASKCDVDYIMNAKKPLSFGYKKAKQLKNYNNCEICMIGDQLLTDIWGAKRMGYFSILVEPIHEKEFILTKFNRLIEGKLFKKLEKEYGIKRGVFYD